MPHFGHRHGTAGLSSLIVSVGEHSRNGFTVLTSASGYPKKRKNGREKTPHHEIPAAAPVDHINSSALREGAQEGAKNQRRYYASGQLPVPVFTEYLLKTDADGQQVRYAVVT